MPSSQSGLMKRQKTSDSGERDNENPSEVGAKIVLDIPIDGDMSGFQNVEELDLDEEDNEEESQEHTC